MKYTDEPIKHEGLHARRLKDDNPREEIFARRWAKQNEVGPGLRNGTLEHLLGDGKNPHCMFADQPFDRHAAMVVATAMQWIGSPVGFSFVVEALKECGYDVVPIKGKAL